MLNDFFNNKIMPTIDLVLQGDIKTIVTLFGMIFIIILVMTVYMDIHNMLKEVLCTLQSHDFIITTKYMLLPIVSLYGLFVEKYPIDFMNNYSLFVRIVCLIWSFLILEYIYTGFIYIFSTKRQKKSKPPKIKVQRFSK